MVSHRHGSRSRSGRRPRAGASRGPHRRARRTTPQGVATHRHLRGRPDEVQRRFLDELTEALLIASSGMSLRPVELLLGDWRATAEAWADPATREALMLEETAPFIDVEL